MEQLLHYVWQHRLYDASALRTTDGARVEVIDPGLHNYDAGPDFFNAKVRVGGTLWVGNVEIHDRASDWVRHGHDADPAYDNVVLHVVGAADGAALTSAGESPPQVVLGVPAALRTNYAELLREEPYPPCWRVVPTLPRLKVHAWLSALAAERLEGKTQRIRDYVSRTDGDWERAFFTALARGFGFGTNGEAFELWAAHIPPRTVAKHRDDAFQVEAFFLGQAGLLEPELVPAARRDAYYDRLAREYAFLRHKFSLEPMDGHAWRFLRLRPQNFPHVRLSQLAQLYVARRVDLSRLVEAADAEALRALLQTEASPYWSTHYTFGRPHPARRKGATVEAAAPRLALSAASLDLLLINTAAPLIFAYGTAHHDEALRSRAFTLLEQVHAERNFITRSWEHAGLRAQHAADSQALVELKRVYCDRKDCLRCRFGAEYLRRRGSSAAAKPKPDPKPDPKPGPKLTLTPPPLSPEDAPTLSP